MASTRDSPPCLEGWPLQKERDANLAVGLWCSTACWIAGPAIYAFGWPEQRRPGTFDLLGASHQTMHVLVLAGAIINGWCIERSLQLREVVDLCDNRSA